MKHQNSCLKRATSAGHYEGFDDRVLQDRTSGNVIVVEEKKNDENLQEDRERHTRIMKSVSSARFEEDRWVCLGHVDPGGIKRSWWGQIHRYITMEKGREGRI